MAYALSGSGTSSDPYIISSEADWNNFENLSDYSYNCYKLASDISVTKMFANGGAFVGEFDGAGHTVTITLNSNQSNLGLFCNVGNEGKEAIIKNLNIKGTIQTSSQYAGGLVGQIKSRSTVKIQNCTCSVSLQSSKVDDGSHGGFIGYIYIYSSVEITDCHFNGELKGESTNSCAGFVGWCNGSVTIKNSLFAPSAVTMKQENSKTFSRGSNITITNSYYKTAFGEIQGTDASDKSAANLAEALGDNWLSHTGSIYVKPHQRWVDIIGWASGAGVTPNSPTVTGNRGPAVGVIYYYLDYATETNVSNAPPTSKGHYRVRAITPHCNDGNGDEWESWTSEMKFCVYNAPKTITRDYDPDNNAILADNGSVDVGTIYYKFNGSWSTTPPTATEAGQYEISYYIKGDETHNDIGSEDSPAGTITSNINVKSVTGNGLTITLDTSSYIYDNTAKQPSVTVYDGTNVIPSTEYTVSYSSNVNAGTATVTITDNDGGNYTVSGSTTFTITKEQLTVTVTANDLYYNYEEQALVKGSAKGSGTFNPIQYSLDNVTYSTSVPKGQKTKTYIVYYKVDGDDNHIGQDVKTIEVTIKGKKVDNPKIEVNPSTFTYDGKPKTPDVRVYDGDTEILSSEFTVSYSSNTNVGTATVTITDVEGGTYTVSGTATFTILENGSSYIAPMAKSGLVYNGSSQELITAGSTTTGTMHYYSLDGKNYSTDIPTGTIAKIYSVYYKVVGDKNHEDSPAVELSVTISSKDVTNPTITLSPSSYFYDGKEKKPAVTVKDGDTMIDSKEYAVSYSNNTNIGSATVTITDKEGGNYIVSGKTTFSIIDPKTGFVPPSAIPNLEYNGTAQELIEAGSAPDEYTIVYSLDSKNYSADIPKGTDAKSYSVYAKVVDKDNKDKSDIEVYTLTATISPKKIFISVTLTDVGPNKTPDIKVVDVDGNELDSKDYSVTYTDMEGEEVTPDKGSIPAGAYTVTVSPTGNYTGPSVAKGILILKDHSFTFVMESDLIAICLPYDREKPAGYDIYRLSSIDRTGFPVFQRLNTTTLSAGEPYLFKYTGASTRGSRILDLSPSDSKSIDTSTKLQSQTAGNLIFVGTFQDMTNEYATKNGSYILQTDGTWKVPEDADNKICLEAFHAYLHYRNRSVHVSPMTMTLTDGGKEDPEPEPVAIDGVILEEEDGSRAWYDLQGHRLDGPQKGVNILRTEDGKTKKVVKK